MASSTLAHSPWSAASLSAAASPSAAAAAASSSSSSSSPAAAEHDAAHSAKAAEAAARNGASDNEDEDDDDEDAEVLVELDNVHKTYLLGVEGVPALRGVSVKVFKGEWIVVYGTSGGGKTTLLNIIGTIDKPTKGEVRD